MKTGKLDQGDSNFIKFFFDLFYRNNLDQNKEGDCFVFTNDDLLPSSEDINVLVCGAGSCVHELPILLKLFESKKYNNINLTFVDKAVEPFKLLHFILEKYDETKNRDSIGKNEIKEKYFNTTNKCSIEIDKDYPICNGKIKYSFHVMDLELDPHGLYLKDSESDSQENTTTNNRYKEFNGFFNGEREYDIVMMSMFLQHISYWRSLIAFLNEHLKKDGYFWFNELGKDDYLLTLDLYMAIIDNKRESKEKWIDIEKSLIKFFESNKDKDQLLFSIISDNDEISPTNTEICRDFFDFFGSKGDVIFEEDFRSDMKPSELFEKAKEKFSPFTKLHSFIEEGETLLPTFSEKGSGEILDFTMKWYAYPKVKDERIKHFNVLYEEEKPMGRSMEIPVLQQYINRTLDILNLNSTIFRPTFLRSKDTSGTMVKSAISLFRRFQLFKIGNFQSIVFYIPDIIPTVKCLSDTKENYYDNFNSQKEFQKRIDKYNRTVTDTGVSNSALFFDKYKTMMTKPFSIFLEPLDQPDNHPIKFEIDEYDYSSNQIVRIISVKGNRTDSQQDTTFDTPLGVSYNQGSLTALYEAFNVHFNIGSNKYRSILIPCFREPLFDQNKEFLGDLIIFQEKKDDNKDDEIVKSSIEFLSWLIRKFIDFTQIATYLDYKRIILQSLKSAIAAIMSRNMSHNLGSHDISNTKNYFGRRINDKFFYSNQVKDEELVLCRSDYRGNVRLLQYIQERMDFIATIVSTDHYPFGPLNFKAEFFDILTNDDCGERHNKPERNFLLLYLLYSEKYTRNNVNPKEDYGNVRLEVIYKDGERYTGLGKVKDAEQRIKTELSKLLLAVPGGVMSRHALFTIVENILRNSAKHNNHVKELVLTIKVKEEDGKIKLSFYDNCESANEEMLDDNGKQIKVWENIKRKLENIIIIDNNGVINKHDKGLKEMLICALWLQNKDVTETLFNIQNGNDNATKYLEVGTEGKNLCYSVTLEKFEKYHVITPGLDQKVSEDQLLNIHADFIMSDKDYIVGHTKLSDIFPRFIQGEWKDVYNEIENTNKKYALVVEINPEGVQLPSGVVLKDEQGNLEESKKRICFYDHLTNKGKQNDFDTKKKDKNIVYLDSISGENFTSTLVTPDFLEDKVLRYKVIQSALARIAILDERIWNNYRSGCKLNSDSDNSKKEQYKQILSKLPSADNIFFLLNEISGIDYDYYEELLKRISSVSEEEKVNVLKNSLLEKINAKLFIPDITCQLLDTKHIFVYTIEDGKLIGLDGNEVEKAPNFDFVTVHLGLVEKLPDDSGGFEDFLEKHGIRGKDKHRPFVSIHSGRGNFSPELEESLKNYPFLSLSAVESALNNSKYLLSELFYNTNYYGKGNINHK